METNVTFQRKEERKAFQFGDSQNRDYDRPESNSEGEEEEAKNSSMRNLVSARQEIARRSKTNRFGDNLGPRTPTMVDALGSN